MCYSLLEQSTVNQAIDEWRRRLSACVSTLKADGSTVNLITGNDFFLFSFAVNVNEQRIIAFLTEKCCYLNLRSKVRTQLR